MKLKLPLALLSALLCCYVTSSPAIALSVNYFNPEFNSFAPGDSQTPVPNPDNFYPNASGDSWHGTGTGKVEGFLRPQTGAPIHMKDLANVSFKLGTTVPTQNALYLNFYSDTYWTEGGLKQKVTVRFKGSFPENTTGTYSNNDFEFVVNNSQAMTFEEFQKSTLLDSNWKLGYTSFSVGNETNINPGGVDIYNIAFTLKNGTTHIWNFIADDTKLTVDKELALGDTIFNKQLTIKGGSNETGGALIYMGWENGADLNDINSPIRILGGNKAIKESSTFTIDAFTRNLNVVSLAGVTINQVDNTPTNRESALITFEGIKTADAFIVIDNLHATASGTNSQNGNKFENQMGAIIYVSGGSNNGTLSNLSYKMSNSSFEDCFASASSPKENTTYGTQGTLYFNSVQDIQIQNVTFARNSISSIGNAALGGAIISWGSSITINDSTFDANSATDLGYKLVEQPAVEAYAIGGAIYFGSSAWGGHADLSALVKGSSFTNNKAIGYLEETESYGSARGGAIYLESRWVGATAATTGIPLTIEDSSFTGNLAASSSASTDDLKGGGAIFSRGTSLTVKITAKDFTYTGNSATLDGKAQDDLGGFLQLYTYTDTRSETTKTFQASANFDIAAGRTLTIGDGTAGYDSIAGNAGSLIVKAGEGKMLVNSSMAFYAGALKINQGTFALKSGLLGASSVAVASGASFIAGMTGADLVTTLANKNISAEKGATLGTYLTNGGDVVSVKHSDVMNSIQNAYGIADVAYTYWTQGKFNIDFSTGDSGAIGGLGEGSTVTVTGKTDELTNGSINLAGGTADLTQVTGEAPISGSVVTGDSGTVVTTTEQTVLFDANQNVGYSLNGGDAGTAGAKLVIGSTEQSNATAPEVVLRGDIHAKEMTLNVGITSVSGTVKTTEGITVGNDNQNTTATLANNGTILGNVKVNAGNTLKGSGTYMGGTTTLAAKSTFVIGNSPGQIIFGENSNLDASDSTFLFAVDGTTAATQGGSTSGTYSNIILRDGVAATGSGNTANIEVWRGLLDATSSQLNLTLINNEGTGDINADFFKSDAIVTGQYADLLKNAKISFDADGNVILTGNLDMSYAQSVIAVDAQAYANSLWSSSQVLSDFGKLSRDQASAPRQKQLNLWMSAMGDFSSVTGTQGYTYNGGGYGIGGDYAFNKSWIAGAGFGQTWGTNKTDSALLSNKQDGTMFSLYGQYAHEMKNKNTFFMDGYFGYAQVENKATAATGITAPSKWSDNAYAAGIRASWALEAGKDFMVTPFVGLDFVTATQGAITVGNRMYHDGKMHNLTMPIGLNFAKKFSLGGTQYLIPTLSVAYAPDLSRENPSVKSSVLGEDVKFTGVKPGRNAAIINLGTRWIITPAWSTAVNYTLEARSKMTNQAVNVSCNYSF